MNHVVEARFQMFAVDSSSQNGSPQSSPHIAGLQRLAVRDPDPSLSLDRASLVDLSPICCKRGNAWTEGLLARVSSLTIWTIFGYKKSMVGGSRDRFCCHLCNHQNTSCPSSSGFLSAQKLISCLALPRNPEGHHCPKSLRSCYKHGGSTKFGT